jgi:type VI secretion system protein ImpJ
MRLLSKVVWHEGMYLAPQHFQAQSRYFEDCIQFAVSSLWGNGYGFSALDLSADALLSGFVSLVNARGVLPDGLPFAIPDPDAAPEPLRLAQAFSPSSDTQTVYLAIPLRRDHGRNFIPPDEAGGADARYTSERRVMFDENTGGDEHPVHLGRKNFRLLVESELRPDTSALAVARLRRDSAGAFSYDPRFVPPCIRIAASPRLLAMVQELVERTEEKSAAIRGTASSHLPGSDGRDLAHFWFLHTLHGSLPLLRRHLSPAAGHPEELFSDLLRLGGGLCTFSFDAHPSQLPSYDHDDLSGCFDAVEQHIVRLLELVLPLRCVPIPLHPAGDYIHTAPIDDPRHLHGAQWILAIRSSAGEADVITKTPRLVKVCSEKFVGELVRRAVPGLELRHLPVPPATVPLDVHAQYFAVAQSGPCWEHIVQTRRVGVYVPGEFTDPELQLMIVAERQDVRN